MQTTRITLQAGQDLSAKQYHLVTLASDGQIDPTGDGARPDGILVDNPSAAGQSATVTVAGVERVKAGGSFSPGALLASDANGKAVSAAQNDEIFAVAIEAALAEDDIVKVLTRFSGRAPKP